MNYDDFIKSKHISERWGEVQGTFESIEPTAEIAYYHELLTEFYDYILHLEAKFFTDNSEKITDKPVSEKRDSVALPASFTPISETVVSSTFLAPQEVTEGEEDPWFGFD